VRRHAPPAIQARNDDYERAQNIKANIKRRATRKAINGVPGEARV
jgi:hypothetical protein